MMVMDINARLKANPVNCSRGAPLGRRNYNANRSAKLYCRKVRLDRGGYDPSGTYWGSYIPLYCVYDADGEVECYYRAWDRADALKKHRLEYPT
jgi:hypothetical protein